MIVSTSARRCGVVAGRMNQSEDSVRSEDAGSDVSAVARAHSMSPQQVFAWRRKAIPGAIVILRSRLEQRFAPVELARGDGEIWRSSSTTRRPVGSGEAPTLLVAANRAVLAAWVPAGAKVYVATRPVGSGRVRNDVAKVACAHW